MLCLCVDSGGELNLNPGSNTAEFWHMEDLYPDLECKFCFTIALTGWRDLSIGLTRIILYLKSMISSSWFTSDTTGTQPSWKSDHFIRLLSRALEGFLQPSVSEMKKCRFSDLHAHGFHWKKKKKKKFTVPNMQAVYISFTKTMQAISTLLTADTPTSVHTGLQLYPAYSSAASPEKLRFKCFAAAWR